MAQLIYCTMTYRLGYRYAAIL